MKSILAIDDNKINLELLGSIINMYYPDFSFLKAMDGTEGIELAKKEIPEIILLDILMPGLNGYEVCEILKKDINTKHIPVLMISALGGNPDERTKGLNAGADAFISKPFTVSELKAQINVALRIKNVEDLLRKQNENLELSIKDQTNKFLLREERIQKISEHARHFYWELNKMGIFVYISPVVESILSLNPLDIIGKKSFQDLFQTAGRNKQIVYSESLSLKETEIDLKVGGKKLWLTLSCFPFYENNGIFAGTRGVCFDITKRKKTEIALKKKMNQIELYQKKLKKLNIAISQVEERERRRIAENLHDSLGQTLSLAYLKLSVINAVDFVNDKNKIYTEVFHLLEKAINESRRLTYDLSPPILYELGLIPTLKWRLEQIEENNLINTKLIGAEIDINLKKENTIFVYRIVNELLQNALKHSKATEITIKIWRDSKKYYLSVCDNGVGLTQFEKDKLSDKPESFGLLSVKERLESFKGRLILKSEPGSFTSATIEIPVKNN